MSWIDYRSARPFNFQRTEIPDLPEQYAISLNEKERNDLAGFALSIPFNFYGKEEQENFIAETRKMSALFSSSTRNMIRRELDGGFGAILVRGLPVDEDLPTTPTTGGLLPPDYKKTFIAESTLLALGWLTGAEPFNFRQEGRGKAPLLDNIVPVESLKSQRGAGGYENNFPFHCESAWHRKRPDYLILLGIREGSAAHTLVFSVEMFEGTSWIQDSKDLGNWFRLKAPDLYFQMEKSGIPMGTAKYSFEPPIKAGTSGVRLNINFNGTDCIDEKALNWLSRLEEFIESKTVKTVIGPGNALILNNDLTCHTRTGYQPSFDGMDRWFLRGYFKKDLWSLPNNPYEQNARIEEGKEFADLISAGWMSREGKLSYSFARYVHQPDEVNKLDGRLAELAALAFHYTPVEGSRIV